MTKKAAFFVAVLLALGAAIALSVGGCWSGPDEEQAEAPDPSWEFEQAQDQDSPTDYPLIIVGLDGFRHDYRERGDTPHLDRLIDNGVVAQSLRPVFPSHTFPNLYSAVTGLYPENHGILANTIYDAERDERFSMRNSQAQQDPYWWDGEPIWVTAETQGLTAATFFWVGSEAPINGVQPTHWREYDSRISHSNRTDQVIDWVVNDGVDFATLYFSSADGTGHRYGPDSPRLPNVISGLDAQIGRLIEGLEEGGLWPEVNIMIFSDHGMTALDEDKVIFLDDIIDLGDVHMITWTPVAMIDPRPGKTEAVYEALKAAEDHFEVYRREEIPESLRIADHRRMPPIMVVAEEPYTLTSHGYFEDNGLGGGSHGYDPDNLSMHGFFAAAGPNFAAGRRTETLHLVDLYGLMAYLLGVEPAPHDGSLERIGSQVLAD